MLKYVMASHMSGIKMELKDRVHIGKLNGTDDIIPQKQSLEIQES